MASLAAFRYTSQLWARLRWWPRLISFACTNSLDSIVLRQCLSKRLPGESTYVIFGRQFTLQALRCRLPSAQLSTGIEIWTPKKLLRWVLPSNLKVRRCLPLSRCTACQRLPKLRACVKWKSAMSRKWQNCCKITCKLAIKCTLTSPKKRLLTGYCLASMSSTRMWLKATKAKSRIYWATTSWTRTFWTITSTTKFKLPTQATQSLKTTTLNVCASCIRTRWSWPKMMALTFLTWLRSASTSEY